MGDGFGNNDEVEDGCRVDLVLCLLLRFVSVTGLLVFIGLKTELEFNESSVRFWSVIGENMLVVSSS